MSLIMEQNKFQQFGNDFKEWQDYYSGSNVSLLSDKKLWVNFVHAKTFVGDKRWAIQTANLTHSSFTKNIEHFVLGTDTRVRDDLLQLFALDQQTILTNGKKNKKWYADRSRTSSPNLLVCPLDCRAKMEYLINNAKQSIRISAQYVTDKNIMNLLDKQQSLDIRIRTNDTVDNIPLLNLLGPQVVKLQKTPYSHDKMLIVDGKYLMIGSMNFSDNALDNNREIGIILTDPKWIEEVGRMFK
jgi:cardiolipin synthase